MDPRWLALAALLLSGCAGDAPDDPDPSTPIEPAATSTAGADATASQPAPPAAIERTIPIAHEGNLGTGAIACAPAPVECQGQGVVAGDKQVFVEKETGRVTGGELTLTWSPSSAATGSLVMGIMIMGGEGEGCGPIDLGSLEGPSPLALPVADAGRDLCPGAVIHVWVATTAFGDAGPAYYQVDVDQPFQIEGTVSLSTASGT